MEVSIVKTTPAAIRDLRFLFLWENHMEFIYDKCHLYGWSDTWLFRVAGLEAGYGALWGQERREDRDCIFEFFLLEPYRKQATAIFSEFIATTGASRIFSQSNDRFLYPLLPEFAEEIVTEAYLFEDHIQTDLSIPGAVFRKNPSEEDTTTHHVTGFVVEHDGAIVATGGFLSNYNRPYADLYMEVPEPFRQRGFGALIVQELKKEIYLRGSVPAARCNITNPASRATLQKAGFRICGTAHTGRIKRT